MRIRYLLREAMINLKRNALVVLGAILAAWAIFGQLGIGVAKQLAFVVRGAALRGRREQALEGVLAQLRAEFPDEYENQLGHTLILQSDAGIHPMFRAAQVGMSAVMMVAL